MYRFHLRTQGSLKNRYEANSVNELNSLHQTGTLYLIYFLLGYADRYKNSPVYIKQLFCHCTTINHSKRCMHLKGINISMQFTLQQPVTTSGTFYISTQKHAQIGEPEFAWVTWDSALIQGLSFIVRFGPLQ